MTEISFGKLHSDTITRTTVVIIRDPNSEDLRGKKIQIP